MMYARLVSFTGADAEKHEKAVATIRERVIPTLREFDGFAGYIALYDEDGGRAKGLLLWTSKETAEAAEPKLTEMRTQVAETMGFTLESVDLYEAPVVELEAVHV